LKGGRGGKRSRRKRLREGGGVLGRDVVRGGGGWEEGKKIGGRGDWGEKEIGEG